MENLTYEDFLSIVLERIEPSSRNRIESCILDMIEGNLAIESKNNDFQAIQKKIFSKGGRVFHWSDLIKLEDLLSLLDIEDLAEDFPPEIIAKIIIKLSTYVAKLKKIGIDIDIKEFKILREIKRGNNTLEKISLATKIDLTTVDIIVKSLSEKYYKEEIPLIEISNEILKTSF